MQTRYRLAVSLKTLVIVLLLLPLLCQADDSDVHSPAWKDAAARYVMSISMPYSIPAQGSTDGTTLQIRKACAHGNEIDAQVYHGLIHFDLAAGTARYESFPFQILDMTCGDETHRRLLVTSWPENRLYSISVKPRGSWSGWRRGDVIKLANDEAVFGYVEGEEDVQVLTGHHLITLKGDTVSTVIALSHPLKVFAVARASILRVRDDIYFGNDGGEWGGTLYRIDHKSGKISLEDEGNPVVSIIRDPTNGDCVLVARALAHIVLLDGGLTRVCRDKSTVLIQGKPVWAAVGQNPVVLAFSDGLGELRGDDVVNQRGYPSSNQTVAGLNYSTLPDLILLRSGITQSVSVSGAVPMLIDWKQPSLP